MHTTNLRKVGRLVMLAVPRATRRLGLRAGRENGLAAQSGRLVVEASNGRVTHSKSCSTNAIGRRGEQRRGANGSITDP